MSPNAAPPSRKAATISVKMAEVRLTSDDEAPSPVISVGAIMPTTLASVLKKLAATMQDQSRRVTLTAVAAAGLVVDMVPLFTSDVAETPAKHPLGWNLQTWLAAMMRAAFVNYSELRSAGNRSIGVTLGSFTCWQLTGQSARCRWSGGPSSQPGICARSRQLMSCPTLVCSDWSPP
jgi:hypothetical protein